MLHVNSVSRCFDAVTGETQTMLQQGDMAFSNSGLAMYCLLW